MVVTFPPKQNTQRKKSAREPLDKQKLSAKLSTANLLMTWTRKSVHRLLPLERMRTPVTNIEVSNIEILGGGYPNASKYGKLEIDSSYKTFAIGIYRQNARGV